MVSHANQLSDTKKPGFPHRPCLCAAVRPVGDGAAGFTYWNTRRTLDAQTDQIIDAEITGLAEQYHNLGLRGLFEAVNGRSQRGGQALYILSDHQHRVLAGNLDSWPQIAITANNFVEFDYERRVNAKIETRKARGRLIALPDNFFLLVAQDVQDRYLTQRMFTTTLPWTVVLILVLGLAGGALMSRNMLQRLDSINRTSGEIFAGDLSRRVPVGSAHDEFDALAENLNRMLDRIERLMKGLREVTDSVAHDLRTPLNRLRNRLEQSLGRLAAAGSDTAEIEHAIADTDQLIGTFNALLLIAETDAGTARGTMAPLDLVSVAADVAELYEPLAEERGIALVLAPGGGATIEGNRSLIAQALANLVDNAIKYTPRRAGFHPLRHHGAGGRPRGHRQRPGHRTRRPGAGGRAFRAAGGEPQFSRHRAWPVPGRGGGAFP